MKKLKLLLVVLGLSLFSISINAKPFGGARNDIKEFNSTLQDFKPAFDKLAEGIFCLSHPVNDECKRNGGILSSRPSL